MLDLVLTNLDDKFRTKIYFVVLDKMLSSIDNMFEDFFSIFNDLSLLSFNQILDKGVIVPNNIFSS